MNLNQTATITIECNGITATAKITDYELAAAECPATHIGAAILRAYEIEKRQQTYVKTATGAMLQSGL